jgi:hypothetical protein
VKVRFLADADLNKVVVTGLQRREPSADFLSAGAVELRGLSDLEVLATAARQGRALISHDVGSMPLHYRTFRSAGETSAGVFLVPQSLDVRTAIEDLLLIWLLTEASEWTDRLEWLPL